MSSINIKINQPPNWQYQYIFALFNMFYLANIKG
jgi:hypothetical protein